MLRKSVRPFIRKDISVPLLCESDTREVLVEINDPLTGEPISKHKEYVSQVRQLDNAKLVSNEPADIYSIENMSKVGIVPVTCPVGGFIKQDLSVIGNIEDSAVELLDATESEQEVASVVEPPKNEE